MIAEQSVEIIIKKKQQEVRILCQLSSSEFIGWL